MTKQLWLAITIVPFLLSVTPLRTPKRALEKTEEEFRKQILADATGSANNWFTVSVETKDRTVDLGDWTRAQLKVALANVHLQKVSMPSPDATTRLRFEAFAGEVDPVSGFYVFPGAKSGTIGGARTSPPFNDKWRKFEITPQSSRALEYRVWKLYSAKLRALHVPAPKIGH